MIWLDLPDPSVPFQAIATVLYYTHKTVCLSILLFAFVKIFLRLVRKLSKITCGSYSHGWLGVDFVGCDVAFRNLSPRSPSLKPLALLGEGRGSTGD